MTIEFHNNSADSGGVIIWTTNSIITIGGGNFTKNQSLQEAVILHSLWWTTGQTCCESICRSIYTRHINVNIIGKSNGIAYFTNVSTAYHYDAECAFALIVYTIAVATDQSYTILKLKKKEKHSHCLLLLLIRLATQ